MSSMVAFIDFTEGHKARENLRDLGVICDAMGRIPKFADLPEIQKSDKNIVCEYQVLELIKVLKGNKDEVSKEESDKVLKKIDALRVRFSTFILTPNILRTGKNTQFLQIDSIDNSSADSYDDLAPAQHDSNAEVLKFIVNDTVKENSSAERYEIFGAFPRTEGEFYDVLLTAGVSLKERRLLANYRQDLLCFLNDLLIAGLLNGFNLDDGRYVVYGSIHGGASNQSRIYRGADESLYYDVTYRNIVATSKISNESHNTRTPLPGTARAVFRFTPEGPKLERVEASNNLLRSLMLSDHGIVIDEALISKAKEEETLNSINYAFVPANETLASKDGHSERKEFIRLIERCSQENLWGTPGHPVSERFSELLASENSEEAKQAMVKIELAIYYSAKPISMSSVVAFIDFNWGSEVRKVLREQCKIPVNHMGRLPKFEGKDLPDGKEFNKKVVSQYRILALIESLKDNKDTLTKGDCEVVLKEIYAEHGQSWNVRGITTQRKVIYSEPLRESISRRYKSIFEKHYAGGREFKKNPREWLRRGLRQLWKKIVYWFKRKVQPSRKRRSDIEKQPFY